MKIAAGTDRIKEIIVIAEKRLMLSKESCYSNQNFSCFISHSIDPSLNFRTKKLEIIHFTSFLTMNFLLNTLRDWLVTLEAIALQKPVLFVSKQNH